MRWVRFGAAALALLAVVATTPPMSHAEEAAAPVTQCQPAGETGTGRGKVLNKSNGDPMIDAGVEVIGTKVTARTDVDGKFKVRLPPGTYQIRIFAPFYQPQRLEGVVVKSREVARVSTSLVSAPGNVQVVEVVSRADRAAEATQLDQRKHAAVVSETMSAEMIKKTPGKDAADVVKRVPAVTVRDDRFIFVRGLGERYSSALLDGSRLPSPDPERRVVPLDLFPANFIESLQVFKTYSPDFPGDFTGGLVDIRLREYPERFSLTMNAG